MKTDEVYIDDYRDRWTDMDMIEFGRYMSGKDLRDDNMKDILLEWAHNKDKENKNK